MWHFSHSHALQSYGHFQHDPVDWFNSIIEYFTAAISHSNDNLFIVALWLSSPARECCKDRRRVILFLRLVRFMNLSPQTPTGRWFATCLINHTPFFLSLWVKHLSLCAVASVTEDNAFFHLNEKSNTLCGHKVIAVRNGNRIQWGTNMNNRKDSIQSL